MKPLSLLKATAVALLASALVASASIDRSIEKSFPMKPGAKVLVDISGGTITVKVGEAGRIDLVVEQVVKADTEAEADEILANYEITAEADGDTVRFITKSNRKDWKWSGIASGPRLRQKVYLLVPADTDLNLDTSGGSIGIDGEISGTVRADTSGGSINVSGGSGDMNLDTSGGSITVGRALGKLRADTSGGSIRVDYVGPNAGDVNCDTSGGSIHIGVDPKGNFDLYADTSGGRVKVEGLALDIHKKDRTHVSGKVNAGGARLRADTSGGNITIEAAKG
ncbi:MAG TPA: DUF4097 family beta strand repeat-containing protein [Opitutaceae bacterium]|nr:DUF4097 family beta strand repeat-containing protein [Opitutaceae bacterium]